MTTVSGWRQEWAAGSLNKGERGGAAAGQYLFGAKGAACYDRTNPCIVSRNTWGHAGGLKGAKTHNPRVPEQRAVYIPVQTVPTKIWSTAWKRNVSIGTGRTITFFL
jgi:hypothetical protein